MTWAWPQWVLAGWMLAMCGAAIMAHGRPRPPFHSLWFIGHYGALAVLLYFGGFWS